MGRKEARIGLMQSLYAMDINQENVVEPEIIFEQHDLSEKDHQYIFKGIKVITNNMEEIDKIILNSLKGWSLNRLAKIDLAIMRIAVYEMKFRSDIPNEVAINEAVEIAKKFSTEDSYKFINGVLGNIVRTPN